MSSAPVEKNNSPTHWHSLVGPVILGAPICVDESLNIPSLGILPTRLGTFGLGEKEELDEPWWKLSVQKAYTDCCRRYAFDNTLKNNPSVVLYAKIPNENLDYYLDLSDARHLEIDYTCVERSFDDIVLTSTQSSGCILSSVRSLSNGYLLGNIDVPTYAVYGCNPDTVIDWSTWQSWIRFFIKMIMLLLIVALGINMLCSMISVIIGSCIGTRNTLNNIKKDDEIDDDLDFTKHDVLFESMDGSS